MEINIKLIVLFLGIILTGLSAGLCFIWSNTITLGIGRLSDLGFLQSFQAMNRTILNGSFFTVFFGPAFLLFINAFLHRNANPFLFKSFVTAAIIYFVGVGIITVFKNVPLNEILDKTKLEDLSSLELATLRGKFEQAWNRWHAIRTFSSLSAFALLIVGILYSKSIN